MKKEILTRIFKNILDIAKMRVNLWIIRFRIWQLNREITKNKKELNRRFGKFNA